MAIARASRIRAAPWESPSSPKICSAVAARCSERSGWSRFMSITEATSRARARAASSAPASTTASSASSDALTRSSEPEISAASSASRTARRGPDPASCSASARSARAPGRSPCAAGPDPALRGACTVAPASSTEPATSARPSVASRSASASAQLSTARRAAAAYAGGRPVPVTRLPPEPGAFGLVTLGAVQRRGQPSLPPDAVGGGQLAHQHVADGVVDQPPALLALPDQVGVGQPAQRLEHAPARRRRWRRRAGERAPHGRAGPAGRAAIAELPENLPARAEIARR